MNQLKSVNNGALGSYGYAGNGKRVKEPENGVTTYYVISSVLGLAREVTSAGVQQAYVMSGNSVVVQLNPNGQFYWLPLDRLGSGRKMTDASGNMTYRSEFDLYGKLLYEWSSPATNSSGVGDRCGDVGGGEYLHYLALRPDRQLSLPGDLRARRMSAGHDHCRGRRRADEERGQNIQLTVDRQHRKTRSLLHGHLTKRVSSLHQKD